MSRLRNLRMMLSLIRREVLVMLALLLLLLGASLSPALYDLAIAAAYGLAAMYATQNAVPLVTGHTRGLLEFVGGLGGVVFLVGLVLRVLHVAPVTERDLPFLVQLVGLAFLLLPLVLHRLPAKVQRSIGVEGC